MCWLRVLLITLIFMISPYCHLSAEEASGDSSLSVGLNIGSPGALNIVLEWNERVSISGMHFPHWRSGVQLGAPVRSWRPGNWKVHLAIVGGYQTHSETNTRMAPAVEIRDRWAYVGTSFRIVRGHFLLAPGISIARESKTGFDGRQHVSFIPWPIIEIGYLWRVEFF